jgi:hypothetical protein
MFSTGSSISALKGMTSPPLISAVAYPSPRDRTRSHLFIFIWIGPDERVEKGYDNRITQK